MSDDVAIIVMILLVSSWLSYHTYEAYQYKPIGQMFGRFFDWCLRYYEFRSKIWIDGVVVLIVCGTIMMAIPFVLIIFWGFVVALPFMVLG